MGGVAASGMRREGGECQAHVKAGGMRCGEMGSAAMQRTVRGHESQLGEAEGTKGVRSSYVRFRDGSSFKRGGGWGDGCQGGAMNRMEFGRYLGNPMRPKPQADRHATARAR